MSSRERASARAVGAVGKRSREVAGDQRCGLEINHPSEGRVRTEKRRERLRKGSREGGGSAGGKMNNFVNMIRSLRPERFILPAAGATAVGYSLMNSYYTVEGGHRYGTHKDGI